MFPKIFFMNLKKIKLSINLLFRMDHLIRFNQLTGDFTYNRDSHLISKDQLIYPNHFHRQIDLKSNLQLIFDQKEKK